MELPKKMESALPDAYKLIIIALVATALASAAGFGYDKVILSGIVAVIAAQASDIGLTYLKTKKFIFADSATISALIIVNIVTPGQYLLIGSAAAAAMLLKHMIRFEKKPVFNPVSSALLVVPLVFAAGGVNVLESITGWGNSTLDNIIGTGVIVMLGSLVALKIRRFASSIAYLSVNTVLSFAMFGAAGLAYFPFFGAFFMFTEPKTTPVKTKHQVIFGITPVVLFMVYAMAGLPPFYAFSLAFLSANVVKIGLEKSKI